MPWPMSQDYNEAIQEPALCFSDPDLKRGKVVCNALGLPLPCSGNFADVYAVATPQRKFAVKCFTRQIPGIRERYVEISKFLAANPLPFMVEFKFIDQGIKIANQWYPILKMHWVEGFNLNAFVRDQADNPQVLSTLCQIWVKLAIRLREASMAHCDLQHGNVLMVPGPKAGMLSVCLVDYDGMFVPALELLKTIEVGHANYQHPQRQREGIYSIHVDRFSHLVIYTALRALMVGGRALWQKFDNGDNLLFKATDLQAPSKSPVFQELIRLNDPDIKMLTQKLAAACTKPLDQTPYLDDLMSIAPEATARKLVAEKHATTGVFAEVDETPGRRIKYKKKQRSRIGLVTGGSAAVIAMMLIGGVVVAMFSDSQPKQVKATSSSIFAPNTKLVVAVISKITPETRPATISEVKSDTSLKIDPPNTSLKIDPPKVELPKVDKVDQPKINLPEIEPKAEPPTTDPKMPVMVEPVGEIRRFIGHEDSPVWEARFSPDGKQIVSCGWDKTVRLWDPTTGKELRRFIGHTNIVYTVVFSPDGKNLLSGGSDSVLRLWDVASGKQIRQFNGHNEWVGSLAIAGDGKSAISGGYDNILRLWDIKTGNELYRFVGHSKPIRTVAMTPNGRYALSGSLDGTVKAWNVPGRKEVRSFVGSFPVCFSADGRLIACGGPERSVIVYDFYSGKELVRLIGHVADVMGVTFSPDGRRVLTAGMDKTVRLWDVKTGKVIKSISNLPATVWSVNCSTDGRQALFTLGGHVDSIGSAAVGNGPGLVVLWRLPE
jgi:WD40 repeat protein